MGAYLVRVPGPGCCHDLGVVRPPQSSGTFIAQDVQRNIFRRPAFFLLYTLIAKMHPTLVFSAALLASLLGAVQAQTLVNGQIFTNGLAIVDAPAPNR